MSTVHKVSRLIEQVVQRKLTPRQAIRKAVSLTEASATYFIPDQDKLNRTMQRYKEAFPKASDPKVDQYGAGYAVTFSVQGGAGMGTLSSLIGGLGGSYQLPGYAGVSKEVSPWADFSGFA